MKTATINFTLKIRAETTEKLQTAIDEMVAKLGSIGVQVRVATDDGSDIAAYE